MQDDTRFREPRRARRIRERTRMQARGARLCARMHGYDRPGGVHRRPFPWTDLDGRAREGAATWADVFEIRAAWARLNRDHLAACSCHMCGNPRKHWKSRTIQEAKALASCAEQLREAGIRAPSRQLRPGWR